MVTIKWPMKLSRFYSENQWDFGFGFCFPSEGKAIPGYWTVRPFAIVLYLGPWTWEFERPGRVDIYSN